MAAYRYDALGRRIEFINSPPGGVTATTRYCYDGPNVIAEFDEDDDPQRTYVHGLQYVDERAVMRDHSSGVDNQDHYYLLGELYTVVGMADCRGWMEEMYVYDTYGTAVLYEWPPGDVNRDGRTLSTDAGFINSLVGTADPWGDANLDGAVTSPDDAAVLDPWIPKFSPSKVNYSSVDNPYFFTGRTTDTLHASTLLASADPDIRRIQDNRNRMYDPKHGRWLQRDPLGYVDGMNLYEYVKSNPQGAGDPSGMAGIPNNQRSVYAEISLTLRGGSTLPWSSSVKFWAEANAYGGTCLSNLTRFNADGKQVRLLTKEFADTGNCSFSEKVPGFTSAGPNDDDLWKRPGEPATRDYIQKHSYATPDQCVQCLYFRKELTIQADGSSNPALGLISDVPLDLLALVPGVNKGYIAAAILWKVITKPVIDAKVSATPKTASIPFAVILCADGMRSVGVYDYPAYWPARWTTYPTVDIFGTGVSGHAIYDPPAGTWASTNVGPGFSSGPLSGVGTETWDEIPHYVPGPY